MPQNEHAAWQRSAMEFETDMIGMSSFAYSGAADECLYLHSDQWGLLSIGAYEPHRRYATQEAALAYARAVKALAERFLAEQEALAV